MLVLLYLLLSSLFGKYCTVLEIMLHPNFQRTFYNSNHPDPRPRRMCKNPSPCNTLVRFWNSTYLCVVLQSILLADCLHIWPKLSFGFENQQVSYPIKSHSMKVFFRRFLPPKFLSQDSNSVTVYRATKRKIIAIVLNPRWFPTIWYFFYLLKYSDRNARCIMEIILSHF